jgi:hypothetical protein
VVLAVRGGTLAVVALAVTGRTYRVSRLVVALLLKVL